MSLRRYLRRRQWDEERAREVQAHLAEEIADNEARGMKPQEARRQAYIRFGNPTVVREEIWQMNSFVLIENLGRDLRFALRQLLRNPGFAAIAILTLALGIGSTPRSSASPTVCSSVLSTSTMKAELPKSDSSRTTVPGNRTFPSPSIGNCAMEPGTSSPVSWPTGLASTL